MAYEFDVNKFYDKYDKKVANQKKKQKAYKNASGISNSMSMGYSPSGFDYGQIAEDVAKRNKQAQEETEERKLQQEQQAEIDYQYQAELEKSGQRQGFMGGVDRVFDVLSTGGYMVNGFLQEGVSGAVKGLQGGLDGFTSKEHGKEYTFDDTLNKYTNWEDFKPESFLGKTGKFAVNLAGEILTDPLSYITGAGIGKSLMRGTGVRATGLLSRKAMKEVTEETIISAGKKLVRATGDDLSKDTAKVIASNASKYAKKANKLAGNTVSDGDVVLGMFKAKKALIGSGDVLRAVGDKTIAPYYNTLRDAMKRANVFQPFTNNGKLRKQIVEGNVDEFVKLMHLRDVEIANRKMRFSVTNSILGEANNRLDVFKKEASKDNKDMQAYMVDILENPKSYTEVEELKFLGFEGKEFMDGFVEQMTQSSPKAMKDMTVAKTLENLKKSDNIFETMKTPRSSFEQYVYKRIIDPTNEFSTYKDAYTNLLNKYHVKKVVNKVEIDPVKSVAQVLSRRGVRNLTPTDIETGLFVNNENASNLSALLKQDKVVSKLIKSPTEAKIAYLNDILFDGKGVIVANDVAETSVNKALVAIRNGADEGTILNALQDSIDLSKNHAVDDLFMSVDEIAKFEETMELPKRYDSIDNRIKTSGIVPGDSKMRIYNKETGELFYSINPSMTNLDELLDGVEETVISNVNSTKPTYTRADFGVYTDGAMGDYSIDEMLNNAVYMNPKADDLLVPYQELKEALAQNNEAVINKYLTDYMTNKDGSDLYKLFSDMRDFNSLRILDSMSKSAADSKKLANVVQHSKETAVERASKEKIILDEIKGVISGDKTIADTNLIEKIALEKQALVQDYVSEITREIPNDFKHLLNDDEALERFVSNVFDEEGNIIPERLANYVGKDKNVQFAINNKLPIKDIKGLDDVAYNSVNVMPKVQFSEKYSRTVRQTVYDLFGFDRKKVPFNEDVVELISTADLSTEAYGLANLLVNGKLNDFMDVLLDMQHADDFRNTPVYELLTKFKEVLPDVNKETKDFRKKNIDTFVSYLDNVFKGNVKQKYSEDIMQLQDQLKPLFEAYNAKNGKFYSPDVAKGLMRLESELPSDARLVKDIYTDVLIDEHGLATQFTYDPYTMETAQQQISRTVLENELSTNWRINQEAELTRLDYFLNHAYQSDVLDNMFNDYVQSTFKVEKGTHYVIREGKAYAREINRRLDLSAYDLADEVKATLEFVFEELKTIGMNEHSAKQLQTTLNNYVPHIINKEMFKNPNIMKAIQKEDPELYRMIFKSAGDKFNPHNVSRSAELEEAVKKILGETYTKGDNVYTTTGKTIYEVNEALRPMLKSAGFDGDFFVNNLYDAFAQRVVTYGDVMYSDKIIDQTLELFGTYVRPDLVKANKTYYLNQKDLRRFFDGVTEDNQYIILQELGIDVEKTYNKMLIAIKGDRLERFYKIANKWKEKVDTLPNFVAYDLPEQIAYHAQNKGYTQALDDTNVILKVIDKFTNLWKQTATVINPGFHLRNKMSNKFQTFLNVGSDTFNPQVRKMTKEILEGKNGAILLENGSEIPYQLIRDELVARDIVSFQNFNRIDNVLADGGASMFSEELKGSGGIAEAIGRMIGVDNPTKFNRIDPTDTANFVGFEMGRKFGGGVEDFDRTINFVSRIRHGESFDVAHDMVNKFMFDYSDLTPFEMNVMKRIVPFYTWLRKNAPLQMEMVLEKPWVYSTVAHTQRTANQGADQSHLPSYMQDWFRLPITFEENDVYANLALPYADLFNDYTNPSEMFGRVNPLIKIPAELAMNKNTYYNTPIWDGNDTADEAFGKIGKYTANSLMGGYKNWRGAGKAIASTEEQQLLEKLTPMVTGVNVKVHDAEKTKGDAIYRAIRNMEEKLAKEEGKKTGFNQDFEEYKKTKLEKYGYISEK